MRKIWYITQKDLLLIVRDPMALVFYLLAPFLLTLGMAAISGSFNSSDKGLSNIPLVITNTDQDQLGDRLVTVLQSEELNSLIYPVLIDDFEEARRFVDQRKAVAALLIPVGFTHSIIPDYRQPVSDEVVMLELFTDGESTYSIGVIRAILETFLNEVESSRITYSTAMIQFVNNGLIAAEDLPLFIANLSSEMETAGDPNIGYKIVSDEKVVESNNLNFLAIMAPGMALMFLMYNVTSAGVSFLIERRNYTLQRNLVSPTPSLQIIIGKTFGIFLRGFLQVLILILASTLLFGLNWGDWLGVVVLIALATYAACGWGMFLTSIMKTPAQVTAAGTAVGLIFGMLGGGFLPMATMPDWLQTVARISPNAWGSQGFIILSSGGTLVNLRLILLALLVMGTVLLAMSSIFFRRIILQGNH